MLGTLRCRMHAVVAALAVAGCDGPASRPAILVQVEVTPGQVFVADGFPRQLTAVARWSDGSTRDITTSVAWSSSAANHVSVTPDGLASFEAVGGATITATDPTSALVGTAEAPAFHVAFMTTSQGDGDLGAWVDHAGAATGAAAGDEICQERAEAAGFPGTFRAWLSDTRDDAYCRIQGLHGKRLGRCGQAALQSAGGPWLRLDGHPFAPALAELATGALYTAVQFDETRSPRGEGEFYWDDTVADGTRAPSYSACGDWTSGDGAAQSAGGSALGVDFTWTYSIGAPCSLPLHLLCLQAGGGPALPPALLGPAGAKRAFITSTSGGGDLGAWAEAGGTTGLAAGDAICSRRAAAARLGGTFRAWLSDGSTDAISRITSSGPWVRTDGAAVAADRAGLIAGRLLTNLVVTEDGTYLVRLGQGGQAEAWTGTLSSGTRSAHHCASWTSALATDLGSAGGTSGLHAGWTEGTESWCGTSKRLYCFEE